MNWGTRLAWHEPDGGPPSPRAMKSTRIALLPDLSNRSQILDVLRFTAVALVLVRHCYVCPPEISPAFNWFTRTACRGGWIGVDLFFVLSGFLISGLLFKEIQRRGTLSIGRFYLRRGFKIYPPFWALMLFTLILEITFYRNHQLKWLVCELLFVQNYGEASQWGYTWSLAVEEHFYLVLPLLLALLLKLSSKRPDVFRLIPMIFGVVAVGCLTFRLMNALTSSFTWKSHVLPTHLRFDALFFGVLLSYWYHFHSERFDRFARRYGRFLVFGGIGLLIPAFVSELRDTPYLYTVGFSQFYVGSGCLLVGLMGRSGKPSPIKNLIAFVGSRSYSIYLWQGPAAWLANERFEPTANFLNWYGWTVTYLGLSVLGGMAMASVVEYPVLGLRDRWFPSRSQFEPLPLVTPAADEARLKAV